MNRIVTGLNNRYLVAAVVALFLVIPLARKLTGR